MIKKIRYKKIKENHSLHLEYNGIYNNNPIEIQTFKYNESEFTEVSSDIKEVLRFYHSPNHDDQQVWVNIHGLHDSLLLRKMGESLGIEMYILSEIMNTNRRASIEISQDMVFFSIKSIVPKSSENTNYELELEQLSFLLHNNELISIQEHRSDFFGHIRDRIRNKTGLIRKRKTDFLLFLLFESVVENYYTTLEYFENQLDETHNNAKHHPKASILAEIQQQKHNLQYLKKSIVPFREILSNIPHIHLTNEKPVIHPETHLFFDRLHHRCSEIIDQIDYDTLNLDSVMNLYFSVQNQRLNEIMKSLTIVSIIFMPLTFIAGIYGMNFDNMPELKWKYAYFGVLGIMLVLVVGMLIVFRKRKWF